jgi:hypothetical protein
VTGWLVVKLPGLTVESAALVRGQLVLRTRSLLNLARVREAGVSLSAHGTKAAAIRATGPQSPKPEEDGP